MSNLPSAGPLAIAGVVQHYQWGRKGPCAVQILSGEDYGTEPCAELWFGSHPSAPSPVLDADGATRTAMTLRDVTGKEDPTLKGSDDAKTLAFMVKVLSVEDPLSIQIHPAEPAAQRLHHESPNRFPDPFGKEEIAYALTDLELLYGFKSPQEILETLTALPQLRLRVEEHQRAYPDDALPKIIFRAITSAAPCELASLCAEAEQAAENGTSGLIDLAFVRFLKSRFSPEDPGVVLSLFLNRLVLKKGEAVFTPFGCPHAYLSGELVECLSNSDNVIRAGLTPKHVDVKAFLEHADFFATKSHGVIPPTETKPGETMFRPGKSTLRLEVVSIEGPHTLEDRGTPSLAVALDGAVELTGPDGTIVVRAGRGAYLPGAIGEVQVNGAGRMIVAWRERHV